MSQIIAYEISLKHCAIRLLFHFIRQLERHTLLANFSQLERHLRPQNHFVAAKLLTGDCPNRAF